MIRHAQAAVNVTLENDGNMSFAVNLCSVVQEERHSVDGTRTQLLHIPLVYSDANADGILRTNQIKRNKRWNKGLATCNGAKRKQAT